MRSVCAGLILAGSMAAMTKAADICNLRVRPEDLDGLNHAADRLARRDFDSTPDGDIHICLESGVHRLTAPLELTKAHDHPLAATGAGRVVWRAESVADTPLVTGGVQLTDWWRCDDGTHCPGQDWHLAYAHSTAGLPNVTSANLPFRQLWVDGRRASRVAQSPAKFGFVPTSTGFSATSLPSSASQWADSQTELRWPSQIRNWIEPRCIVVNVTGTSVEVDPECWAGLTKRNNDKTPPVPAWIENTQGPPGPGEFFSTPDYIFYRPPSDEPYAPPTNAWAPVLPVLLVANGITAHDFVGMSFSHATWRAPSEPGGYVPSQTLVSNHGEPQGAVRLLAASDVSVRNCTFQHIGAAYGLEIGSATQGAVVADSTFEDHSGGAVKLANVNDTRAITNDTADWDTDYVLTNCNMSEIAVEFRGGAAVFAGYIANYTASHNTVRGTGYTGFSTGWGWGNHVHGPQTFARLNSLTFNAVIDPMSALNDGGCFYTLGPSPGSISQDNYCAGDRAPVVGGVYRDNGSRYWNVTRTVVEMTPAPCVYLQGCCDAPAYNISVSDIWCRDTAPIRNECQPQGCDVDNATITYVKDGTPWPAQAQAIIDAAGARP